MQKLLSNIGSHVRSYVEDATNLGIGQITGGVLAVVVAMFLLLVGSCALALEPGHYGPGKGAGVGLTVECQDEGPCAAIWYNYVDTVTVVDTSTHQGQVWLYADPPCPRGLGECAVDFLLTKGSWNGNDGEFEFTPPVGSAVLDQVDPSTIEIEYEVLRLRSDVCFDQGSGGLILEDCAGTRIYDRIVGDDR